MGTGESLLCCSSGCTGGSSCPGAWGTEGRGSAEWGRRPGNLASQKAPSLKDNRAMSKYHFLPQRLLSTCFFHLLPMPLVPGAVPAWSCFSFPLSPPCQCSQPPSHPLCAQLCPADPPGSRVLPRGISVCKRAQERLRQFETRTGVLVPAPERRNKFPSPPAHPANKRALTLLSTVKISPPVSSQHPATAVCLSPLCAQILCPRCLQAVPSALLRFAEELLLGRAVSLQR